MQLQGDDVAPIPDTKHAHYVEENVAPVDATLTPEDVPPIEQVAPKGVAAGEQCAAAGIATVTV